MRTVSDMLGLRRKHANTASDFGFDLRASQEIEGFDVLTYSNADYRYIRGVEVCGFHVVRDPRDVIASGYFSHLQSHRVDWWPELPCYRQALRRTSKEIGLLLEMEFASTHMNDLRSWPNESPGILLVRFEELVAEPFPRFLEIFQHLGITPGRLAESDLRVLLKQFSFESLSNGRRKGQEDIGSHYRLGIPGDWARHFTDAHVWAFKHRYNDLLTHYGYEADDQWRSAAKVETALSSAQLNQLIRARLKEALRQLLSRLPLKGNLRGR